MTSCWARGDYTEASPISGIWWLEEALESVLLFFWKFIEDGFHIFLPFQTPVIPEDPRDAWLAGKVGPETDIWEAKIRTCSLGPLTPTHHHSMLAPDDQGLHVHPPAFTRGVLLKACKGMTSYLMWSQLLYDYILKEKEKHIRLCFSHFKYTWIPL